MNRHPLLLAALPLAVALVLAGPLLAPPAAARDARIAARLYAADEVVRIPGRVGVQASIAFAEDERIENVAIGDSTAWQVTPNKRANLLFVKPLAARAQTNMTVVTDRRTYFFDLEAGAAGPPLYVLRFTYPDEPKPAQATAEPLLTPAEEQALAARPTEAAVDPASLNFAWKAKGKAALLPARVYDDGQSTFLSWAAKVPIPAIQVRNEAGAEGPVNFAVRDDVTVIEGVPGVIVLRSGRDVATLERAAPVAAPALAAATSPAPKGN